MREAIFSVIFFIGLYSVQHGNGASERNETRNEAIGKRVHNVMIGGFKLT